MLNSVIVMGRITAPLELKQTPSGVHVLQFSIAVQRNYKNQNGERDTDFFNVVAWRYNAEMIARYFDKGNLIIVQGNLQNRTYTTQNGENRHITEIIVEQVQFSGEQKKNGQNGQNNPNNQNVQNNSFGGGFDGFTEIEDDGLPF